MSEAEIINMEAWAAALELKARLLREGAAAARASRLPSASVPVVSVASDPDEKLTVAQVVEITGWSESAVYESAIPRAPSGGKRMVRFHRREVEAFLARDPSKVVDFKKARSR